MKRVLFVATVAALLLTPMVASASLGQRAPVQVRVVTWKGEILADRPVTARTTTVPTSSRALCFGGKPTNGKRVLEGPTALGALQRATAGVSGLRPLLLTNAFDFGLGVCAVGRHAPVDEEWWALSVNGALSSTGGDSTFLKGGDRVLWYLDRSFNSPMPEELRLIAPSSVPRGGSTTLRVLAYDGQGKSRPAPGIRVFVGPDLAGETDAAGRLTVRITNSTRLVARLPGLIPSNRVAVKVEAAGRAAARR